MKIKGLTIIFFFALTVTVWINFVDYKFSTLSIFAGKEEKLENIIDNFCLSFIAGYFLNVYLIERAEKKSILPYIAFKTNSVISRNKHLVQVLKADRKLKSYYPTKDEFKKLLEKDNLDDLKIFNFVKYNFIEYLKYNRKSNLKNINKILKSGKYVDDDLKVILFSLKESLFIKKKYAFNSSDFDLSKMTDYNYVFYKYSEDIKKLEEYFDDNLKKYYYLNFPKYYRRKIKNSL